MQVLVLLQSFRTRTSTFRRHGQQYVYVGSITVPLRQLSTWSIYGPKCQCSPFSLGTLHRILHNTLTFLAPFGFSDSIATFALWVFYGRFGCLLLLVWKTWQHSVLDLQYLTWQLMSTSIVGSDHGKVGSISKSLL